MNRLLAFILIGFSLSQTLHASFACAPLNEDTLSFDNLKALIQSPFCEIHSVGDVLKKLPPGFASNYMLFYRSRSLQGPHQIDYLNPRALVYSSYDKPPFVLSFNGDPAQPGYRTLEMTEIHLESPDNVFRYFEIEFPYDDSVAATKPWLEVQSHIAYSGANPPRCTACHGTPARPIIPGYPDWEGAFGSLHVAPSPMAEQTGFQAYVDKVRGPAPSRYKSLGDPGYGFGETNDLQQLLAARDASNESFHGLLGSANAVRVAPMVQKTQDYRKLRYALTAAFAGCDDLPSFLPKRVRTELLANTDALFGLRAKWQNENIKDMYQKIYVYDRLFMLSDLVFTTGVDDSPRFPYAEYLAKIRKKMAYSLAYERLQLDTFQIQGIQRGDFLGGNLRMLMEGRGLNIDNWFTDLTQPTYRYHDGGAAAERTAQHIAATDPTFDAELKRAFAHQNSQGGMVGPKLRHEISQDEDIAKFRCERLKELSLRDLHSVYVAPVTRPPNGPTEDANGYPLVFTKTCAECHDSGLPLCVDIPFTSPEKMAAWIADPVHFKKLQERVTSPDETVRMPPTSPLSEADFNAILKYLSSH